MDIVRNNINLLFNYFFLILIKTLFIRFYPRRIDNRSPISNLPPEVYFFKAFLPLGFSYIYFSFQRINCTFCNNNIFYKGIIYNALLSIERRFLRLAVFGGIIANSNNCDIGKSVANVWYARHGDSLMRCKSSMATHV